MSDDDAVEVRVRYWAHLVRKGPVVVIDDPETAEAMHEAMQELREDDGDGEVR